MTEWRKITGFKNYSVSDEGEVRRDACECCGRKGNPLKKGTTTYGYFRVSIIDDDGVKQSATVHSLVAAAFIGPRPSGMVVRHRNGDRKNNSWLNLLHGTHKENTADAVRHGTIVCGERHAGAKLGHADVVEIRRRAAAGEKQSEIGDDFNVSQALVSAIHTGKNWKHLFTRAA